MKISSLHRVALFLFIVLMYPSAMLAEEIPLLKKGGVYQLPVKINADIPHRGPDFGAFLSIQPGIPLSQEVE
jgi:hypothetical protein